MCFNSTFDSVGLVSVAGRSALKNRTLFCRYLFFGVLQNIMGLLQVGIGSFYMVGLSSS